MVWSCNRHNFMFDGLPNARRQNSKNVKIALKFRVWKSSGGTYLSFHMF